MMKRVVLALLLLLPAAASAQDLDIAVSAVVRISGTRNGTQVKGTGFVIALDRDKATIVTASHVIEGVQQLEVTFAVDSATSFHAGAVLGMEPGNQRGLAVFQVRGALPAGIMTLSFETEDQLQRGEDLFLVGFPQMAKSPLTLRRTFAGPLGNLLQLDLPAGEGFSGAPVLRKGKVLGVVTDEDPQLTFAVKSIVAKDAVIGWGVKLGGQSISPVTSTAQEDRSVTRDNTAPNAKSFDKTSPACKIKMFIGPDDASVYLDGIFIDIGQEVSKTGLTITNDRTHRLAVVRPGYRAIETTLTREQCGGAGLRVVLERSGSD